MGFNDAYRKDVLLDIDNTIQGNDIGMLEFSPNGNFSLKTLKQELTKMFALKYSRFVHLEHRYYWRESSATSRQPGLCEISEARGCWFAHGFFIEPLA